MATNKEYNKPRLVLGDVLWLFDEDYDDVVIVNHKDQIEFIGELGEIRNTSNVEHYERLKKIYVKNIGYREYGHDLTIFLEKPEVEPLTMDNFPPKPLLVVDILNWVDKKEHIALFDGDLEKKIFEGRAEDLQWTSEGCLHELATRKVAWFEAGELTAWHCLLVYLEEEESKDAGKSGDSSGLAEA